MKGRPPKEVVSGTERFVSGRDVARKRCEQCFGKVCFGKVCFGEVCFSKRSCAGKVSFGKVCFGKVCKRFSEGLFVKEQSVSGELRTKGYPQKDAPKTKGCC